MYKINCYSEHIDMSKYLEDFALWAALAKRPRVAPLLNTGIRPSDPHECQPKSAAPAVTGRKFRSANVRFSEQ